VALATILVVDDTAEVLELTASVLEEAGYAVLQCAGSGAALPVLRNGQAIDLLLTDISMPGGLNGFELAQQARVARPSLPVAYLTGQAHTAPHGAGEESSPVLRKPYRRHDLVRLIDGLLAAAEDARLVQEVALEMTQRHGDARARAHEAEEIDRAKGDELSAKAWHDIAKALDLLQPEPRRKT
jgi:CheY-like chemotaxis protein